MHLASWPAVDEDARDDTLVAQMDLVRKLVELGRSARTAAKVRTRQPLARAVVAAPGWSTLPRDLVAEVADELNVVDLGELSGSDDGLVDVSVKIDFRAVGRRLGKQVQSVAQAVAAADPAALTAAYRGGTATVDVGGEAVSLLEGDLIVTETPREGWTVASGSGLTVALDLTLTPELERAGLVREVVRLLQEARKNSGLDVSDRIELWWTADGALAEALQEQATQVAGEVLAVTRARRHGGHRGRRRGPRGLAVLGGPRLRPRPEARHERASGGEDGVLSQEFLAALRARSRSARCRSGVHRAHGVKPSVRASSSGIGMVSRPARNRQPSRW